MLTCARWERWGLCHEIFDINNICRWRGEWKVCGSIATNWTASSSGCYWTNNCGSFTRWWVNFLSKTDAIHSFEINETMFFSGPLTQKDQSSLRQNMKSLCQNMNMSEIMKKLDSDMWTAGLRKRDITSKNNNYARGKALIDFICDKGKYMYVPPFTFRYSIGFSS